MRELPEAHVKHIQSSARRALGFYQAVSGYCYQVTLITNSFVIYTPKFWVAVQLHEDSAIVAHHLGSQRTGILELWPDAERGGYEPAELQGSRD